MVGHGAAREPAHAADSKAPATKTTAAGPNVVSGTVVADDGSPVVGAKVIIYGSGTRWSLSDAKGHFRIEHVSATRILATYSLTATIWSHRKSEVAESIGPNPGDKTYTPMQLTMVEGKRAKFSLVSSKTGKPVVGAMIRFQYPDFRRLTTDKDGVALAAGLFAENYGVDIYGEGFERTQAEVDLSSTGSTGSCKVELNPGGIIRGVVVDDAGKPIAGVNILFSDETAADNWSPDARRAPRKTESLKSASLPSASNWKSHSRTINSNKDRSAVTTRFCSLAKSRRAICVSCSSAAGQPAPLPEQSPTVSDGRSPKQMLRVCRIAESFGMATGRKLNQYDGRQRPVSLR